MNSSYGFGIADTTLDTTCLGQLGFESASNLARKQLLVSVTVDGTGGVSNGIRQNYHSFVAKGLYIYTCIHVHTYIK